MPKASVLHSQHGATNRIGRPPRQGRMFRPCARRHLQKPFMPNPRRSSPFSRLAAFHRATLAPPRPAQRQGRQRRRLPDWPRLPHCRHAVSMSGAASRRAVSFPQTAAARPHRPPIQQRGRDLRPSCRSMPAAHAQWSRHGAELERLISRAQDTANLRTRFAITQRHYRRAVLALFYCGFSSTPYSGHYWHRKARAKSSTARSGVLQCGFWCDRFIRVDCGRYEAAKASDPLAVGFVMAALSAAGHDRRLVRGGRASAQSVRLGENPARTRQKFARQARHVVRLGSMRSSDVTAYRVSMRPRARRARPRRGRG